jgi:hypothetical protein
MVTKKVSKSFWEKLINKKGCSKVKIIFFVFKAYGSNLIFLFFSRKSPAHFQKMDKNKCPIFDS